MSDYFQEVVAGFNGKSATPPLASVKRAFRRSCVDIYNAVYFIANTLNHPVATIFFRDELQIFTQGLFRHSLSKITLFILLQTQCLLLDISLLLRHLATEIEVIELLSFYIVYEYGHPQNIILYLSTTWERPSRRDGPRRRSSATVLDKAYAVGDIARRIPLRSNGPFFAGLL